MSTSPESASVEKQKLYFYVFVFNVLKKKTSIRFGFCDIQNNQSLGKGYQTKPKAADENVMSRRRAN